MTARTFDPREPLPAPPDPWQGSGQPSARPGPPYHMTDMIAAEPHVARRLLARLAGSDSAAARLAEAVRATVSAGRAVIFTGCGTSEHAAQGAVEILREALGGQRTAITAEQALELAFDPPGRSLVIGISHEGGTAATNRALEAARAAGSRTALVTAAVGSPGAALSDLVVATGELDQSWCHTIGYLAPLVAATAVAGHLTGAMPHPDAVGRLVAASAGNESDAETTATRVADATHLVVLASGADRPAGRELVLKVEEGAWLPSAYRDIETFLHGHLSVSDETSGLVLILTDRAARLERVRRARQALAAVRLLDVRVAAILAEGVAAELPADLTPAGRLAVPEAPDLPSAAAALLGSASPLQLLTERLARVRGTNPDTIRRDDSRYREASAAATPEREQRG